MEKQLAFSPVKVYFLMKNLTFAHELPVVCFLPTNWWCAIVGSLSVTFGDIYIVKTENNIEVPLKPTFCKLEAVVRRWSVDKVFLEISQISHENTLAQVFSFEFCESSKNAFLHRTLLVAASVQVICYDMFNRRKVDKNDMKDSTRTFQKLNSSSY